MVTLLARITSVFFWKIASCLRFSYSGAGQCVGLEKRSKKGFDIIVVHKLVLHANKLTGFIRKAVKFLKC